MFLLVNSAIVCRVSLDEEFSCVRVQSCFGVDPVLDCYMYPGGEEEGGGGGVGRGGVALPKVAGKLVDFAFSSPLLFMLHQSNVVCILTFVVRCTKCVRTC